YTSGLADAGPNDMQISWLHAVGGDDDSLRVARLLGAVMRVFSVGTVRLRSDDPHDDPIVEFDMLSDERDFVRLRDCLERMIAVVRHDAVASVVDDIVALDRPIDDVDDAWLRERVGDY